MSLDFEHQCYEYAGALERLAVPSDKDLFLRALARDLVLQGKGPDQAARLARATWAELYPKPAPTKTPPVDRVAELGRAWTPETISKDPYCPRDATQGQLQAYAEAANRIPDCHPPDPDILTQQGCRPPLCDRDTMPLSMQGCRLPVGSTDYEIVTVDPDDLYHSAQLASQDAK